MNRRRNAAVSRIPKVTRSWLNRKFVPSRPAALQAGPVHVDDGDAFLVGHLRAAVVEREQVHLASGVAQPLRHWNPEPGLVGRERRDQDRFGRGGHAGSRRLSMAMLASGMPVALHRARVTANCEGSRPS
jgi:hypothetical protein